MRNRNRRGFAGPEQPLSAGRIEYLEHARQRAGRRRLRRAVLAVAALTVVLALTTGLVGTSVARAKDLVDTVRIALTPEAGWPQQTGITELVQLEELTGGFVALGEDACAVYSTRGSRLHLIQSGYARPALAVGSTRFVLYNRSGRELRVESRTQSLYTKTMDAAIYLCAMARDGTLAVVTDDVRNAALLTVYSPMMEQQLSWGMTSAEGIPLRAAFSPDSRQLALAAVAAGAGQVTANLYLLGVHQGDPVCIGSRGGSLPQWLGWLSGNSILVVYDRCAVLYNAAGGERASYDFNGRTLAGVSVREGGVALLLSAGQAGEVALLDNSLNLQYSGPVPAAHGIVRARQAFYLLTDDSVECYGLDGTHQWGQQLSVRPQGLLAGRRRLLVLGGNTVQELAPPEPETDSAAA